MNKITEWIWDNVKEFAMAKKKNWFGFDEFIDDLKNNNELNMLIENKISLNQSNEKNTYVDQLKYINLMEENVNLKNELNICEKNNRKIKITKRQYKGYLELLENHDRYFSRYSVFIEDGIFSELRAKGIIKVSEEDPTNFEIVLYEKDLEII
ncbi:MAG: hypothetical protein ACRC63_03220 [Metamycoplasmataceae bacterium]